MAPALATPPCCCRSLRAPPHHWPVGSCQIPPAQSASYQYGPHVGACRSPKIPPPRRFGGHQCQSLVAFAPPVRHMTGAAGDTTTTDSRSRRNRASRRGGQLLTRALGSSCVSACPHIVLPVPLSRWSHHTPRSRIPQRNVGTEKSHTGYQPHRKHLRHRAPPHHPIEGCLSNGTALAVVFKLVEGAQKSWRRLDGYNQLPKLVLGVTFNDG